MQVKDIMTKDVVTVRPETETKKLAELLVEKDISGVPVVDAQGVLVGLALEESLILQDKRVHLPTFVYVLVGFLTIGEQRFEEEMQKIAATTVEGIMEREFQVLSPETPVEEAATMVIEQGKHYFPVVENGKLAGVVTKKDIVRAIAQGKIW